MNKSCNHYCNHNRNRLHGPCNRPISAREIELYQFGMGGGLGCIYCVNVNLYFFRYMINCYPFIYLIFFQQGKIGFALVPKASQFDRPNVDIQEEINDEEEEDESAYALELGASLSNILESCSVDRIRLRAFTKGMFKPSELSGEPLCDASLENIEESGIEELDTERGIKPAVRFKPGQ